jgi:hypothetical protein
LKARQRELPSWQAMQSEDPLPTVSCLHYTRNAVSI